MDIFKNMTKMAKLGLGLTVVSVIFGAIGSIITSVDNAAGKAVEKIEE